MRLPKDLKNILSEFTKIYVFHHCYISDENASSQIFYIESFLFQLLVKRVPLKYMRYISRICSVSAIIVQVGAIAIYGIPWYGTNGSDNRVQAINFQLFHYGLGPKERHLNCVKNGFH